MITQKVINTPKEKVRKLQRTLYRAAKANRKRKFGVLYDKVWRWDILMEATKRVLSNKGCPGVDGQTVEEIRTYGVERFVAEIQKELREKTYHPDQVLRKYIPKPNGKLRALGIPTVKDRIIQMAVKLVIEPIFEADFQMCSFGYRPKKSAQDARAVITYIIVGGAKWVLDVDLKAYFDTIPHDKLMVLVQERVHDKWILRLIRWWLKAGILDGNEIKDSKIGSPQGGVISPLLSNIYLNLVDRTWYKNGYQSRRNEWEGVLIRYADDILTLCKTEEAARYYKQELVRLFEQMGLQINEERTRIVQVRSGFDFLGYHFREGKSWAGKPCTISYPSAKAMNTIRTNVKTVIRSQRLSDSLKEVIGKLNPVLAGWGQYFRCSNAGECFGKADYYVQNQLRLWMRRKHARKWSQSYRKYPAGIFYKLGLHKLSGTTIYKPRY